MGVSYQRIDGKAEPLPDDILVVGMEQGMQVSSGGIILSDDSYISNTDGAARAGKGVRARWAQVYKIGDNVKDVKPGEWVLVEHGRWSYAIDFIDENKNQVKLQKIDPTGIMLVADEYLGNERV